MDFTTQIIKAMQQALQETFQALVISGIGAIVLMCVFQIGRAWIRGKRS